MQDDYLSDSEFDEEIDELEKELFSKPEEYEHDIKIHAAYDDGYFKGYYDGLEKASKKNNDPLPVKESPFKEYEENKRENSMFFLTSFFALTSVFLFCIIRASGLSISFDLIMDVVIETLVFGLPLAVIPFGLASHGELPFSGEKNLSRPLIYSLIGLVLVGVLLLIL